MLGIHSPKNKKEYVVPAQMDIFLFGIEPMFNNKVSVVSFTLVYIQHFFLFFLSDSWYRTIMVIQQLERSSMNTCNFPP